jgi:hypothetical protein
MNEVRVGLLGQICLAFHRTRPLVALCLNFEGFSPESLCAYEPFNKNANIVVLGFRRIFYPNPDELIANYIVS